MMEMLIVFLAMVLVVFVLLLAAYFIGTHIDEEA